MFIDDSSKIAMLADTMPGMSNLNIIFTSLYQELNSITTRFEMYGDQLVYKKIEIDYNTKERVERLIKINRSEYIDIIRE